MTATVKSNEFVATLSFLSNRMCANNAIYLKRGWHTASERHKSATHDGDVTMHVNKPRVCSQLIIMY